MNLDYLLNKVLVIDIETSSFYPNGKEISIQSDFDNYVEYAQVKWIGCYSYRENKYYDFEYTEPLAELYNLLESHDILVGHNLTDFDYPILKNTTFLDKDDKHLIVDTMTVLGKSSFFTKGGFPFKNRGTLMEFDFPSNSLRVMAETMKVETQKGDIDFHIFQKYTWTDEEKKEIRTYLQADVMATKQMFDKLWSYWMPFTEWLPKKSIEDLAWVKGSIASVIYKSCCNILGEEPTYADALAAPKEEMGGNVILPVVEEARKVWYVDFASLYPHIMAMTNLFAEVDKGVSGNKIWHGDEVFQVRGYYDVSRPHKLAAIVTEFLKKRIELKKTDPTNPLVYTYKIFLNGLYGCVRSATFEKVHKPNAGWDCCWLGQQCQKIVVDKMKEFGFSTIAGDTDSVFLLADDDKHNDEAYVRKCLKEIVEHIFAHMPFRVDTFSIAIEHFIDYIMYSFEEQAVVGEDGKNIKVKNRLVKERKGLKKNYLYIWTDKNGDKHVEIKGLPIKKGNATALGYEIYTTLLEQRIKDKMSAKFDKAEIDEMVDTYLKREDALEFISQEYSVKPAKSYKLATQIHAQISNAYFGGGSGVIRLIKNHKYGKAGKGVKLCSIEEARAQEITTADLSLEKLYNELAPFIKEKKHAKETLVVSDNKEVQDKGL